MKFDASRALKIVEELGGPRFAGPDWEARTAEFVAERMSALGLQVERCEVIGSRFPTRVAPWAGWLGYGVLNSAAYIVLWHGSAIAVVSAIVILVLALRLPDGMIFNWIRLGRTRAPVEMAPLVIARSIGDTAEGPRVVFQAALGDLKPWFFHARRVNAYYLVVLLQVALLVSAVMSATLRARRPPSSFGLWPATVVFLLIWAVIACILWWEHRQSRLLARSHRVDRRGLAVLIELARSWQPSRSHPVQAVFVAAGGQQLDCAGSREVLRRLQSEWKSRPSLLSLLLAPGAGQELLIGAGCPGVHDLAVEAAGSLWIPHRPRRFVEMYQFWPFAKWNESVAIMGANPAAFFDASGSPDALHRAAQLATEIALRWAKQQRPELRRALDS
jgi:hypothetical protein